MQTLKILAVVGLALAASACTRPDRLNGLGPAGGGAMGADAMGAAGAAAGASDPRSPQYFQQAIGDRVLFNVDSSALTPAGMATLDGQAGWLQTNADYRAIIEGHADEQGTREYNLALGARRANVARDYLISRGVSAERLRTVSYGKERPIEVCSDEACYAKNRRAVTVISVGSLS